MMLSAGWIASRCGRFSRFASPVSPATRKDPRYDILRFGLETDMNSSTAGRLWRAMSRAPRSSMKAAFWWIAGARLRAAMRLRAQIGDRIRFRRTPLEVSSAETQGMPAGICALSGSPADINQALRSTDAGLVLIAGHGCRWCAEALPAVQAAFDADPALIAVHTDALVTDLAGVGTFPLLGSAFDPDHALAIAPMAPALAIRSAALLALGGLATDLPGSEVPDLCLRILDRYGPTALRHVAGFAVIWDASAANEPVEPGIAETVLAARLALARRHVSDADADIEFDRVGALRVRRHLPKPPKVSVIIPTRDRIDLLRPCIEGLLYRTDYQDLEILIVDNGSIQQETLDYFRQLAASGRTRILPMEGPFNFSRLNNAAASVATGSMLLLLNNDISMLEPDWLQRMVAEASRPDVGAVGAKLLYPSGLVQHGGVVLGLKGLAGHAHQFFPGGHRGYLHRLEVTHRVAAVTAACLAVQKEKYWQVGGLDEANFAVALNDVDFCLKLDAAGYRNLMVPAAVLTHHESATRASDRAAGEKPRWMGEVAAFRSRWPGWLDNDPFYHSLLGQDMADFSLPKVRFLR